jgi:hypothetical protein
MAPVLSIRMLRPAKAVTRSLFRMLAVPEVLDPNTPLMKTPSVEPDDVMFTVEAVKGGVVIELDAVEGLELPREFIATTVKVYVVLAESPVTEIVPELAPRSVPDAPDGLEVTEYDVIAAPPLLTGAVKETVAVVWLVEVAVRLVGAPGVVLGVAVAVAAEPAPIELLGVTVNVY